jgi:3-oxoacyl-[acyl-carrier protein] reductase
MEKSSQLVLVTGGTRGIGRAIVEELANVGRTVAFTWTSKSGLAEELEQHTGGKAHGFHLDLRDRSRTKHLFDEVEESLGELTGLVNNAGVQRSELLALSSDETWDHILDVNLGGTFRMSREAVRVMIRRRAGSIVNVASLSALHGVAGQSAYAASKAGILATTRCLAREVGRFGIRVNAVVPGFVETDMTADLSKEVIAQLRASESLPNGIKTNHIASVVEFLLSDASAGITGQTIVVDAGTSG